MPDRFVKAMGTSHVHILEKGESFDGRYPDGLTEPLVFDQSNRWVVNVGGLPQEVQDLIAEQPDFLDVTGLKRVPDSEHQKMFHPRVPNAAQAAPEALVVDENASETLENILNPPDPDAPVDPAVADPAKPTKSK